MLRHVAGKLQRSGKWWPASTDLRAAARGVPDVGLARSAIEVLERAGLVHETVKAGVHRVGLVGERRAEIARLIERGEVADVETHGLDQVAKLRARGCSYGSLAHPSCRICISSCT